MYLIVDEYVFQLKSFTSIKSNLLVQIFWVFYISYIQEVTSVWYK